MSINVVILTGRLVADPELKYTQSGKPFAKFRIAVNRNFGKSDEADFINIVAWDKTAETIAQYMRKGNLVGVKGRLTIRNYEDENKQKRSITEVIVEQVEFLESKKSKSSETIEHFDGSEPSEKDVPDDEFPF